MAAFHNLIPVPGLLKPTHSTPTGLDSDRVPMREAGEHPLNKFQDVATSINGTFAFSSHDVRLDASDACMITKRRFQEIAKKTQKRLKVLSHTLY